MPDDPGIVGVDIYLQAVCADAGAPFGWSMSNGLKETIGT
jgi:hypothetical protein